MIWLFCLLTIFTFQHGIGGYYGGNETSVYANDPDTLVGDKPYIECIYTSWGNRADLLIQFKDINIPLECIVACTLNMYCYGCHDDTVEMLCYEILEPWDEDTTCWNNRPEYHDVPFGSVIAPCPETHVRYSYPISYPYMPEYGFALVMVPRTGVDRWRAYRTKDMSASVGPKLIIDAKDASTPQLRLSRWGQIKTLYK